MAVLLSPGVSVTVTDESFYSSTGAGTVPLFFIATAANKTLPSGSGVAPYTQPARAGELFLATSQRELLQNFGNFEFKNVQGTPLHGHELNEYGLQAAYSYLGIANRAYILRANIDLNALAESDSAPRGPALPGTFWLDLSASSFGVFRANGSRQPGAAWVKQDVKIITPALATLTAGGVYAPNASFGFDGDIAIVVVTSENRLFEKVSGTWYEIGSTAWVGAHPTVVRGASVPPLVTVGSAIEINGDAVTFTGGGALVDVVNDINAASIPNITASIGNNALVITEDTGGDITIINTSGTPLTNLGIQAGVYYGVRTFRNNNAQYPDGSTANSIWVKGAKPNNGANWVVKFWNPSLNQWVLIPAPLYPFDSTLPDGTSTKDAGAFLGLGVPTAGTVYVGYDDGQNVMTLRRFSGTMWEDLTYEASFVEPSTDPADGAYWYSTSLRADIMIGDGMNWVGYRRRFPLTDPQGVILSGAAPMYQTDGTALVDNDLWIDTTDLENYPALYRYNATRMKWIAVDKTDQTTPFGVVFADARQDSGSPFVGMANPGTYAYGSEEMTDMLVSDYVDPDAPDPRTFPNGMLLFNTRFSTYNVKQWKENHFKDGNFDPNTDYTLVADYTVGDNSRLFPPVANAGRWVTASGNRYDGAPYMGRKAQRVMVVRALTSAIESNQDIRSEVIYYNLLSCPGYTEVLDNLVTLNTDQKEFAFIVGDAPARLKPSSTDIERWATNKANTADNGDEALLTRNRYVGVYYPWGYASDLAGNDIMVPPSSIAMRTFAYNDQVAYPWFAPAGFQRGLVTNASSVGYLTSENEFQPTILNQGQRDTLYINKINPIAYIVNRGLVVYGQKTLSPVDSAMDRINVARLINYLKYRLDSMMKVFLFEINDQQTRDAAKVLVERFLAGLVSLRALYDFLVICDETNNSPERIDRNELWIDLLIKPAKVIEFIYVPIRIQSTGADLTQAALAAKATP